MNKHKKIYVWCDWESTGIWVENNEHIENDQYESFNLPRELVARFKYWERWFSDQLVEYDDKYNKMDWKLYNAYGLSLAIELKRFLGNEYEVFYDIPRFIDGNRTFDGVMEIILAERERYQKEEGRIVPIGVPYEAKKKDH